jgi:Zn-dependent protease
MLEASDTLLHVRDGVVYLVALVLSICVHEFGHAFVADMLGDPLPRAQGRVTLNPLAHIDLVGTIILPVVAFVMSMSGNSEIGARILGWGKPVRISLSARSITRKLTLKTAHLFIALAGPMMNLVFALVLSVVYVLLFRYGGGRAYDIGIAIAGIVGMNIGLAFFNLIPCPPLDGGAVLRGILPRELEGITDALERYGFIILFALLMTGALSYFMIPARIAANWWLGHLTIWFLS